ncbi:MAG TPA: GNAT family N-acetyltransferase [Blastocatellia bacterium]|nr:GNAT family N-acetyltransferase [Blastocatellia bacterium]
MKASDTNKLPPGIIIRNDLKSGDIGYLTYLHGKLYGEEYGWDHTFEGEVAVILGEFAKTHNARNRIWIVEKDGTIAGSIAIVEASERNAQLRLFLLHPSLRGHGIGRILMDEAISFCRESDYSHVFLWTAGALNVAAKLYRSTGFQLAEENTHEMWGAVITEQRYDLNL